ARLIKSICKVPIIFGGIHVTSCPEEVIKNDFVDYAVLGEGEQAVVDLVENPKKTSIKNTWVKKNGKIIKNPLRNLLANLDELPFPDRMLYHAEAPFLKDVYHCMTSRGCPFGCTYCFNNFMRKLYKNKGQWLRRRSVDNVIQELKIMKEKLKYKQILFVDDCFTNDIKWLSEFIKKYKKEIDVPFKAIAHPFFINKQIVSALKEGGCIRLQLGVQTPIERVRRDICKRCDSNKVIENAVREIKKQGISFQVDHIFGLPGEKIKDYEKGIEFYINLKPNYISSFWLQYYPCTEIIETGRKSGEFDEADFEKTISGKLRYEDIVKKRIQNSELLAIAHFFSWIPLLPRGVSRYLLKKRLYKRLFSNEKINKIPYIIHHLSSLELIKTALISARRKRLMKLYVSRYQK
ncbi:MAG: radical SAM protein, partial [Candidatus Nanoarchaeia archaeon]|nr:radical SAM protein [Candidatus Nanoarchaeia archaeon]